jgi:hypothetical protein
MLFVSGTEPRFLQRLDAAWTTQLAILSAVGDRLAGQIRAFFSGWPSMTGFSPAPLDALSKAQYKGLCLEVERHDGQT